MGKRDLYLQQREAYSKAKAEQQNQLDTKLLYFASGIFILSLSLINFLETEKSGFEGVEILIASWVSEVLAITFAIFSFHFAIKSQSFWIQMLDNLDSLRRKKVEFKVERKRLMKENIHINADSNSRILKLNNLIREIEIEEEKVYEEENTFLESTQVFNQLALGCFLFGLMFVLIFACINVVP